jgi:hypothetical protein
MDRLVRPPAEPALTLTSIASAPCSPQLIDHLPPPLHQAATIFLVRRGHLPIADHLGLPSGFTITAVSCSSSTCCSPTTSPTSSTCGPAPPWCLPFIRHTPPRAANLGEFPPPRRPKMGSSPHRLPPRPLAPPHRAAVCWIDDHCRWQRQEPSASPIFILRLLNPVAFGPVRVSPCETVFLHNFPGFS